MLNCGKECCPPSDEAMLDIPVKDEESPADSGPVSGQNQKAEGYGSMQRNTWLEQSKSPKG
eukprot:gene11377-3399_t